MAKTYDVIVLGLGAMGAAATYQLALRGASVLGLDQFHAAARAGLDARRHPHHPPGLRRGSAIHAVRPALAPDLAQPGGGDRPAAAAAERRRGDRRRGRGGADHGVAKFLEATVQSAKAWKLEHEVIDGGEIARRFPAFAVAADDQAYYDRLGGFVRPENCIAAQLARARARGAELQHGREGPLLPAGEGRRRGDTALGTYRAAKLIVAAGPWLPGFLEPALARQFGVTRQVLYWFRAKSPAEHARLRAGALPRLHLAAVEGGGVLRLPRDRLVRGGREDRHRGPRRRRSRHGRPHGVAARDRGDGRDLPAVPARPVASAA